MQAATPAPATTSAQARRVGPEHGHQQERAEHTAGTIARVCPSTARPPSTVAPASAAAGHQRLACPLGERDQGPEPEQQVARLAVDVAERLVQAAVEKQLVAAAGEQADDEVAAERQDHGSAGAQDHRSRAGRRAAAARGRRTARRRAASGSRRSSPGRPTPPSPSRAATTARGRRGRPPRRAPFGAAPPGRAISRPSSAASRPSAIGPQTETS